MHSSGNPGKWPLREGLQFLVGVPMAGFPVVPLCGCHVGWGFDGTIHVSVDIGGAHSLCNQTLIGSMHVATDHDR